MKITTIIFGFFLSVSSYSGLSNSFRPNLPERFLPPSGALFSSESPIFTGMFGEVFSHRNNIGLIGKEIFGKNRPLKKAQFIQNLSDLGTPIPSGEVETAYKNYVTRWMTEAIAPFYFRAVLNLEAENDTIDKKLINKFYWVLFNRLPQGQMSPTDQISYLRHFVRGNISFSFQPTREEIKEALGLNLNNDVVFHLDLSSLHRLSLNENIEDEDFYKSWLKVVDEQILEFIKYLNRSLVIASELKKESEKNPMLLMNYFDEDQEFIYQQLTNVHRSTLKQMNYEAEGVFVQLSIPQKLTLQREIDKGTDFKTILKLIRDLEITIENGKVRKFVAHKLDREAQEDLWSPIRILQGRTTLVKIKNSSYFIPNKIVQIGEFVFPFDSLFARKVVRDEINQRKKNFLLRKVSLRLSSQHPLLLNFGKCYNDLVNCFPEDLSDLIKKIIVSPKSEAPKDYLRKYDLGILEKSIY